MHVVFDVVGQGKATEAAQWCTLDHEHGPNCKRWEGRSREIFVAQTGRETKSPIHSMLPAAHEPGMRSHGRPPTSCSQDHQKEWQPPDQLVEFQRCDKMVRTNHPEMELKLQAGNVWESSS